MFSSRYFYFQRNFIKTFLFFLSKQVANTPDEKYTAAFNEIYRAGMEARKMKNYFNANGTTYFLDSSIYIVDEEDLGNNLYLFQKRIVNLDKKQRKKKLTKL